LEGSFETVTFVQIYCNMLPGKPFINRWLCYFLSGPALMAAQLLAVTSQLATS